MLDGLWFHAHLLACEIPRRPRAERHVRFLGLLPLALAVGLVVRFAEVWEGEDAQHTICASQIWITRLSRASVGVVLWRGHYARYGGLL